MSRHTRPAPDAVSPKVTGSTGGSAAGIVVAWLLTRIPFLAAAPAPVQAAFVVLVIAGATFAGGYLRRDPARG